MPFGWRAVLAAINFMGIRQRRMAMESSAKIFSLDAYREKRRQASKTSIGAHPMATAPWMTQGFVSYFPVYWAPVLVWAPMQSQIMRS